MIFIPNSLYKEIKKDCNVIENNIANRGEWSLAERSSGRFSMTLYSVFS